MKSEELRVMRDEGRLAVVLAGLAAGVARLGNCRIQKKSFSPLNCHSISTLRGFLRISILHSFALFCSLLHSFALCGNVKIGFCNFALEIRRKPVLKSLARTCDVRPHIASMAKSLTLG